MSAVEVAAAELDRSCCPSWCRTDDSSHMFGLEPNAMAWHEPEWQDVDGMSLRLGLVVSTARDGQVKDQVVELLGPLPEYNSLSPEQARRFAEQLVELADLADAMPAPSAGAA